jgi:hypothetical protein
LLKRSDEEIAVYDAVLARFGESTEAALREQVAMAFVSKGSRLESLNRSEEAVAAYNEVVRRFGDSRDDELQEIVNRAAEKRKALTGK